MLGSFNFGGQKFWRSFNFGGHSILGASHCWEFKNFGGPNFVGFNNCFEVILAFLGKQIGDHLFLGVIQF